MMLYVEMKIKTATGATIPKNKMVAPCNDILTTLFRSCRVYLGENLISKKAENYGYRWYAKIGMISFHTVMFCAFSYITDLLSSDTQAKYSWMMASGDIHLTICL